MADPAKTAKKRAALPPRIVQKTPRYPTAENQAQSTRKLLVRPSMMREARMTTTATATPLLGITPPSWVRHLHVRVTGLLGLATGRKRRGQPAPPDFSPKANPGHHRLKKRRRRASAPTVRCA